MGIKQLCLDIIKEAEAKIEALDEGSEGSSDPEKEQLKLENSELKSQLLQKNEDLESAKNLLKQIDAGAKGLVAGAQALDDAIPDEPQA